MDTTSQSALTDGRHVSNGTVLDSIISTIGDLPASPAIVSTVMGLTSDLNSKLVDVSRVLASDQSLTAKVLKLSNSSFYGRPGGVKSLQEAVLILGFFTVRSIVVATSAYGMFKKEDKNGPEAKLWRHSLSTAVAARQLADAVGHPQSEEVFIAALMHDIGKLVMIQKLSEKYRQIIAEVEETAGRFDEIEQAVFGFTHCDVAAVLLEKWSFPPSLIRGIERHHQLPEMDDSPDSLVPHVIHLANYMAKRLQVGFTDYSVDDLACLESAKALSLSEDKIAAIDEQFRERYEAEMGVFEEL